MDTSKKYIRMCDCEEIQDGWKPAEWDYVLIDEDDDYRKPYIWCALPEGIADSGVYGPPVTRRRIDSDYLEDHKLIWLPRQDQLQALCSDLCECGGETICLLIDFYRYAADNAPSEVTGSYEQLWLAFVMYEKHQKTWDDENGWVEM